MAKRSSRGGWVLSGVGFGAALGIALGALVLAPNLPDGSDREQISAEELSAESHKAAIAQAQAASADSVISALIEPSVAGELDGRSVLVIAAPGTNEEDLAGVKELLGVAGATDAGTITLNEIFFSTQGADQLKTIVTNTLPAGALLSVDRLDPGVHAGQALGSALMVDPESGQPLASDEERALLLSALSEAGFLDLDSVDISPAQAVVILSGDSDGSGAQGFEASNLAYFVEAVDSRGAATVLSARIHAAADTGAIGLVRSTPNNGVSTVDSVDRAWGKLATVLSVREQLRGEVGAYGSAESAEAAIPAP